MIRYFVQHPVTTWMLFLGLVLTGLYALPKLEIEAMPEEALPSVTVVTSWNGASPAAIQRSLTIPVEAAARKVHGVEEVLSRSRPGVSEVTVRFLRDTDMEFAQLDLSEQLGEVRRNLPPSAQQPRIVPYVPDEFRTEDFLTISLISPLSANELRESAEIWLKARLLAITGVADVELQGGARPLMKVLLDYDIMEQYRLHADRVYARIAALDDILPAGAIRRGGQELALSVQDSVTVRKILDTVVANVGGQPLTLDRIGDLVPDFEDPVYFVRINGDNVIQASVAKRSGTNAVAVSRRVRDALPQIRDGLPFPVEFEIDSDQGQELEDKLYELVYRSLAILGLLFVLLAAALRRVRLTAIVVVSILFAIVICLTLFYFFGISVNFITISGLTVCFGMLLDNSILVLDAIHRRLEARRHPEVNEILVRGTREVAFPITATTLTTVVAFLSFIFLSGRLALYYKPLAKSVGLAMLASIFVAFAWIPVALRRTAASELAEDADAVERPDRRLLGFPIRYDVLTLAAGAAIFGLTGWLSSLVRESANWTLAAVLMLLVVGNLLYERRDLWLSRASLDFGLGRNALIDLLKWAAGSLMIVAVGFAALGLVKGWDQVLDLKTWFAGGLALMIAVGVFACYVRHFTSFHLVAWTIPLVLLAGAIYGGWHLYENEVDEGGFWRQPDQETLTLIIRREVGTEVTLTSATLQKFEDELTPVPDGIHMKATSYQHSGYMVIEFDEHMLRTEYPEMYRNQLIMLAEELGGMRIMIFGFGDPYFKGGFGGMGGNSTIKITGYNSKELEEITDMVQARLARNRRVRNVQLTGGERFTRGQTDETLIVIDRNALARNHISVQEVVGYLRRLLGIEFPWHMILDGRDQRLQMAFRNADNIQYDQVAGHVMTTLDGNQVRLSELVSLVEQPVISTINRENQRYAVHVTWEYIGTDKMRNRYVQDILAGIETPYGYTAEDVSGQQLTEDEEEEMNSTLWRTILFIFMTLAALFESLSLPMLVLLSLPMALSGVMVIFWQTGSDFDSSAKIGLVLLFGIVVNNAVLLINRFRIQVREMLEDRPDLAELIPAKRRLGGSDLHPLPGATRLHMLQEAIRQGTGIQLRSILLTSGTTIAGMLPLLIKRADVEGKDIWENLALSSIGGLASSTVLIISAIPVIYYLAVRVGWRLNGRNARGLAHALVLSLLMLLTTVYADVVGRWIPALNVSLNPTKPQFALDSPLVLAGLAWLGWILVTRLWSARLRWRGLLDAVIPIYYAVLLGQVFYVVTRFLPEGWTAGDSSLPPVRIAQQVMGFLAPARLHDELGWNFFLQRQLWFAGVLCAAAAALIFVMRRDRRSDDDA